MLMRTLAGTITLWLFAVSMARAVSIPVLVDARGTYLHTSSDPQAALPTIVDLAANGVVPGFPIGISFAIPAPGYSYRCVDLDNFPYLSAEEFTLKVGSEVEVGAGLVAVFSTSGSRSTLFT